MATKSIRVQTRYFPPSDSAIPALALQVTHLVDSYMLWIGTTEMEAENVDKAPLAGALGRDWACAMPAIHPGAQPSGTSLFCAPNSDVALAMAQRLGDSLLVH
ncbi:hypothetical protein JAAARDRAFT_35487 [Jaapia argillacea MUCL 33604]|uniref:Uncharacterized protein n=1 Tax=Jaapia argillacea MUCL 33604 TaxID=933084 RepID=A0A067Q2S3_9AGAM|nr:hypothetical protein JAAARDRAFT_35487 [Jaapia argillacea MUCL 33604]